MLGPEVNFNVLGRLPKAISHPDMLGIQILSFGEAQLAQSASCLEAKRYTAGTYTAGRCHLHEEVPVHDVGVDMYMW